MNTSIDITKNIRALKALNIVRRIYDTGYIALFAGGCVRDFIMGYEPHDIDIATSAPPDVITHIFNKTLEIGASFGIIKVFQDGEWFEVGTFRGESLYKDGRHPEIVEYTDNPETDAKRRDFTINGLFFDVINNKVIDFVGGVKDIKSGILRTIGEADRRLNEDYLRILRALRFAVRFGFSIDTDLLDALKRHRHKLMNISWERIADELNKIFTGKFPEKALILLADTGILQVILPEIDATRDVPQPKRFHPEGDVFTHICLMLSHMAWSSIPLAWSILLHDAGKPITLTIDEKNIEHFYGHNTKGAEIAAVVLRRLRMPGKLINSVSNAVKRHMTFANIQNIRESKLRRLIADDNFPLELELHRIDCIASHGKLNNYFFLLDYIRKIAGEPVIPPPLITGRDLIKMGVPEGPEIGKILKIISSLQLENKIKTREEALEKCKIITYDL